jgi:hypothetical protein
MRLLVRPGLGVLLAIFLAGCEGEPLAVGSLTLRLDVQPRVVSPDDSFTVHLVIRNGGFGDTTLTSGCSLPTFFALDGPDGLVYPPPGFGCLTVITNFRIAPGDSLTMTRKFVARDTGKLGYPALPPGEYAVFTDWQIRGLPVLQQPLTVQ